MATAHPVTRPYALKTATALFKLTSVGATVEDFSDHIDEITLAPSQTTGTPFVAINGKTIQENGSSTWSVTNNLVQDLDDGGFLRWLLDHEGQKCQVLYTFAAGTDPLPVTVTLASPGLGGKADGSVTVTSVTMPIDGAVNFDADAELE